MYVPSTRKIISSYDVVFDESFSSTLAYTSRPYSEVMDIRPSMTYTPCATSLKEENWKYNHFCTVLGVEFII